MPITIQRVEPGSKDIKKFVEVAYRVYRDDPAWIAPLRMDMADRLSPKKNPLFEHAEVALWVAERDGELVGRISATIDQGHLERYKDGAGFFGYLDTIDDKDVCHTLLDTAAAWLREKGMKVMRGPMSLNINEELGLLIEGFDTPPVMLMPHHRSYQAALVDSWGLTKCKDLYAWDYKTGAVPARAQRAHEAILKEPGIKIRQADTKFMERDVRIITEVFNDAWEDNWGFLPATEREVKKMAEDFKLILEPKLALIAEIDGEPAAVSIAIPNINEAIRDLKGELFPFGWAKLLWRLKRHKVKSGRLLILGIKKKFRAQRKWAGLSIALYVETNKGGLELGIERGELGWTLEDNGPINVGIKMMGGKIYKKYRVYEKPL